ncbi:MAG: sigma-54-dependent Fis family transcriptional regulator [Desulfuromonas sp.]|nr:MAG: sigma-54-dependent Fis family transcriptional regulator [Desulfuromonas sp.]
MLSMQTHQSLPARLPDLVATRPGHREWLVLQASGYCQELSPLPGDLRGRLLSAVFPEAVPPLGELCDEVAAGQAPLGGVLFRSAGEEGELFSLEVHPWGKDEETHNERIAFFFRPARAVDYDHESPVAGLVGQGPAMREVFRKIASYARSDASVVVSGETGTGKELVAAALHERSGRANGPYVSLNCAAISEQLLESELFGHEKGSFTGALRTHKGRFERADGGTLFLDEIGDMPLALQAKLLRVLETGRLERVGAEREQQVDVRIICATHRDLEYDIAGGRFRADLYHRLAVLHIGLPPLRERREDIPHLVRHFLEQFNRRYGQHVQRLTPEAVALLQAYAWPGNVRELRNVLERVYVETQGEIIGARAFREWVGERQKAVNSRPRSSAPMNVNWQGAGEGSGMIEAELVHEKPVGRPRSTRPAELDADEIRRAYQTAQGNLSAAARLLGVHRATLYRYMKKLGLDRSELS